VYWVERLAEQTGKLMVEMKALLSVEKSAVSLVDQKVVDSVL
jgi:hypothetical protein